MGNTTILFDPHGNDAVEDPNSNAWLDNGSFSLRQPHTSNATESRFSQQVSKTATTFMAQGQGAILKHHDWLFLSTWSSSSFHNVVKRLYPNNATIESTITLDKAQCTLPQKHSSSYYGMYGFRDWTLTDDERLFGILSGYKYPYGSTAPVMYHRVVEMDVSRDDVWTCIDSYDVSPQLQDYVAIAYDHSRDVVWIVHNSARSIVPYTFSGDGTGQYQRGDTIYTFSSSSGSSWDCGRTGQLVRGLEVNESTFFMRCQKTSITTIETNSKLGQFQVNHPPSFHNKAFAKYLLSVTVCNLMESDLSLLIQAIQHGRVRHYITGNLERVGRIRRHLLQERPHGTDLS